PAASREDWQRAGREFFVLQQEYWALEGEYEAIVFAGNIGDPADPGRFLDADQKFQPLIDRAVLLPFPDASGATTMHASVAEALGLLRDVRDLASATAFATPTSKAARVPVGTPQARAREALADHDQMEEYWATARGALYAALQA